MKLLIRYLTVLGIAIVMTVIIITYQRSKTKTSDQSVERYTRLLINKSLNALVVDKSITDVTNRIQSANAMTYSLRVYYIDIASNKASSFIMNYRYGQNIKPGDTITKNKQDQIMLLHKKGGQLFTLPVK